VNHTEAFSCGRPQATCARLSCVPIAAAGASYGLGASDGH